MDRTPASLLVRLRASNDPSAWERFVRLFTPVIYQVARGASLKHDDAVDLVQEVYLVLVRKLHDFDYDPSKSFRGWLRTVTLNKVREHLRKKRLPICSLDNEALPQSANHDGLNLLEEEEFRSVLAVRALELMRAEFSPTTWQACWQHVVSGRTAAEVGGALGISEGAVYAAKCRVLQRLRAEFAGLLD